MRPKQRIGYLGEYFKANYYGYPTCTDLAKQTKQTHTNKIVVRVPTRTEVPARWIGLLGDSNCT
jgi:hypothetical protein